MSDSMQGRCHAHGPSCAQRRIAVGDGAPGEWVILSAAKDRSSRWEQQLLHCVQHDMGKAWIISAENPAPQSKIQNLKSPGLPPTNKDTGKKHQDPADDDL